MSADPVEALAAAVAELQRLVEQVPATSWDNPTPCAEWQVHDLVAHLVAGQRRFAHALGSESSPDADPDAPVPATPRELTDALRASGSEMVAAFRRPGALEQVVTVPVGSVPGAVAVHLRTTETLAHGWDLERATGVPAGFAAEVAEQQVEFTRGALGLIPADRRPFAPSTEVSDTAPALDRLAALLGRSVDA